MARRRRTRAAELRAIARAERDGRIRNVDHEATRKRIIDNEHEQWPQTELDGWNLSDALYGESWIEARAHLNRMEDQARGSGGLTRAPRLRESG